MFKKLKNIFYILHFFVKTMRTRRTTFDNHDDGGVDSDNDVDMDKYIIDELTLYCPSQENNQLDDGTYD